MDWVLGAAMRQFKINPGMQTLDWCIIIGMIVFLIAFVIFLVIGIPISISIGASAVLGCLYLLPVVCTRIALAVHPLRSEKVKIGSVDHCVWWFTFCTQHLFLRFPFLEES